MQEIKIRKYEYRIQGYKDTRIQGYKDKDTRMQDYKITRVKGCKRIQGFKTKSNNGSKIDTKK